MLDRTADRLVDQAGNVLRVAPAWKDGLRCRVDPDALRVDLTHRSFRDAKPPLKTFGLTNPRDPVLLDQDDDARDRTDYRDRQCHDEKPVQAERARERCRRRGQSENGDEQLLAPHPRTDGRRPLHNLGLFWTTLEEASRVLQGSLSGRDPWAPRTRTSRKR